MKRTSNSGIARIEFRTRLARITSGRIPRTIASRFLLFAIIPPLKNELPGLFQQCLSMLRRTVVICFPCRHLFDGPFHRTAVTVEPLQPKVTGVQYPMYRPAGTIKRFDRYPRFVNGIEQLQELVLR